MAEINKLEDAVFTGEQGIPKEYNPLAEELGPIWWVAEEDGKIIGAAAVWHKEGQLHWGRYLIIPEYRGRGFGRELAHFTFSEAFKLFDEDINMEARDTTVKIVESMGGKITGEPFEFFGANCTPLIIEKNNFKY